MEPLHPLHAQPRDPVIFGVGHGFRTGQGALRGVTTTIKKYFAPNYNSAAAVNGELPASYVKAKAEGRTGVKNAGKGGFKRGRQVDRQLTRVVRLMGIADIPTRAVLALDTPLPESKEEAARKALGRLRSKLHPFTRFLLERLSEGVTIDGALEPLQPIDAQVCVGVFHPLRLGTAVDLVCRTRAGDIYLVEIKTGYPKNYHMYCGPMEAPLGGFRDSPLFQHQLQVLLTEFLYHQTFPDVPLKGSLLLRITEFSIDVYHPHDGLRELLPKILARITQPASGRGPQSTAVADRRVAADAARRAPSRSGSRAGPRRGRGGAVRARSAGSRGAARAARARGAPKRPRVVVPR